jgi:secreted trypsin-like serine protease
MAGLKDDAQWIVLMGFLVSFSLFFLAMILNQSVVVGQTTAEAVSEFPKDDIMEVRSVIINSYYLPASEVTNMQNDITVLALNRQDAVVGFSNSSVVTGSGTYMDVQIHYNNGVTAYNETWQSP